MRTSTCGVSSARARSDRPLQRPLVVDAEGRVRNGLQPLLADRAATGAAAPVACRRRSVRGRPRFVEQVVCVLLETFVELAQVRLRGAVGDVVARADGEVAGSSRTILRGARPGARAGVERARPRGRRGTAPRSSASLIALRCGGEPMFRRSEGHAVENDDLVARRAAETSSRSRRVTSVLRQHCEDGVVRPAALGRRADPQLPRVAVPPDDPRRVAPGTTRSRRLVRSATTSRRICSRASPEIGLRSISERATPKARPQAAAVAATASRASRLCTRDLHAPT